MKDEGFKINDKVYDVLKNDAQNYGKKGDIAEVPVSAYNSVKSSFDNEYNDAAIVVLRRYGGEEGELNHGLDGIWEDGEVGVPELALHQDEKDLLNMIKSSGQVR